MLRSCLILAVACLAQGCNSKPPYTPSPDPIPARAYPNIVLAPALDGAVVVNEPTVLKADEMRPLRISIPLRSFVDRTLILEYRFLYYDANRHPLTDNPVWKSIEIAPRHRAVLSSNSISLDAVDYEVQIRPLR